MKLGLLQHRRVLPGAVGSGIDSAKDLLCARGIGFDSSNEPVPMDDGDVEAEKSAVGLPSAEIATDDDATNHVGVGVDERLQLASRLREELEALAA
jgi:hypothetical protein